MAAGETKTTRRRMRKEVEMLETALFAAGAALLVSCLRKILPFLWNLSWPVTALLQMAPPSLFLVLILNLVIASIVVVSVQPEQSIKKIGTCCGGGERGKIRKSNKRKQIPDSGIPTVAVAALEEEQKQQKEFVDFAAKPPENEEDGEAKELNARAEAFIAAFRRQLRVDSFSSGIRREAPRE